MALLSDNKISLISTLIIIVSLASFGFAQSGRRPRPSDKPAPPVVTASPAPAAQPAPPPPLPPPVPETRLSLALMIDNSRAFGVSTGITNTVINGFIGRMKQAEGISTTTGKSGNRKDASDLAKQGTDIHVILLDIVSDNNSGIASASNSPPEIFVEYTIFAPQTGKVETAGRIYLRPYQPNVNVGKIALPVPIPNVPGRSNAALEYSLKQAGAETADRVLTKYKISSPGPTRY